MRHPWHAPFHRKMISLRPRRYTIEVEIHDGPYNVIKNWVRHPSKHTLRASDSL